MIEFIIEVVLGTAWLPDRQPWRSVVAWLYVVAVVTFVVVGVSVIILVMF